MNLRKTPFRLLPIATLCAVALLAAGCGPMVNFKPIAPRTQYFEQVRQVSLSFLGMTFQTTEDVKYKGSLVAVSDGTMEMTFTPLDYMVTTTQGFGRNEIYGTKLLKQPGETQEVTALRNLGQKDVRVRVTRDGNIDRIATDDAPKDDDAAKNDPTKNEERPYARQLREKALHESLKRVFLNTHIMMAQSVLPEGEVRVGRSYHPNGAVFTDAKEEALKLMLVESIDDKGIAALRVDRKVIEKMFQSAASSMELPKELNIEISFSGDGDGLFHFDTRRRCITDGKVSLVASAKMKSEENPNLLGGLSMRVDIALKEIPDVKIPGSI